MLGDDREGVGPGSTRVSLYAFVHMYHPAAGAAKPSIAFANERREGFDTPTDAADKISPRGDALTNAAQYLHDAIFGFAVPVA